MAKAKKGKATKSDKASKGSKLPKSVAGIELPKELRKQGGKLLDLVKNPLVGDLVAAGLVALAANVRQQSKPGSEPAADKPRGSDAISKTAVTLATVVAARAAEKLTSKLTERPASAQPPAEPAPPAPASSDTAPVIKVPRKARSAKPRAPKTTS